MKLNIPQLKTDIAALEEQIREVKPPLRQPWTDIPAMANNMARLQHLRVKITNLMITRAWHRGKLHCTNAPHGAGANWDAKNSAQQVYDFIAPKYEIAEEAQAV